MKSLKLALKALFLALIFYIAYELISDYRTHINIMKLVDQEQPIKTCVTSDIEIVKYKARYVRACNDEGCINLKGTAMLNNKCADSVGIEIKIIGYDKDNNPISVNEFWPAGINNIAPGYYPFSLDFMLDYDRTIKRFSLEPSSVIKR